jgi:hypothetical protein
MANARLPAAIAATLYIIVRPPFHLLGEDVKPMISEVGDVVNEA